MHSFEPEQTWTGDSKMDITDCLAGHATALLVFANDKLHEVWALLMQLVLACILVHLVDLIVAASEAGQSF